MEALEIGKMLFDHNSRHQFLFQMISLKPRRWREKISSLKSKFSFQSRLSQNRVTFRDQTESELDLEILTLSDKSKKTIFDQNLIWFDSQKNKLKLDKIGIKFELKNQKDIYG